MFISSGLWFIDIPQQGRGMTVPCVGSRSQNECWEKAHLGKLKQEDPHMGLEEGPGLLKIVDV